MADIITGYGIVPAPRTGGNQHIIVDTNVIATTAYVQKGTGTVYFAGTGLLLTGNTFSVNTNYINALIALFNLANGVPSVSQNGALSITNLTVGNSASASFANQSTTAVRASQLTGFIVTNNASQPAGVVSSNLNTITIGSAASVSNVDHSIIITQSGGTNLVSLPTSNGTLTTGWVVNSQFAEQSLLATVWTAFSISNSGNTAVISIGGTNYSWTVTHTP